MPPKHSDYQPLGQGDDNDGDISTAGPSTSQTQQRPRRASRPGKIDLARIDDAFQRWKESIAAKLTRKSFNKNDSVRREIVHTVFHPVVAAVGPAAEPKTLDHKPPMTKEQYAQMTEAVRAAIANGVHPKLIAKGSSGSYFARAKVEGRVQTVGVFKPKDEEPYGNANPKLTKWLHRQFSFIIPFGRACLIPNLSYISEAAASLLDERLGLYIVPRTELVSFSTPAFFYPWLIRRAARKGKPLPDKIGSMQCFMHGFQDASAFLREHPLPGRSIADTYDDSSHRKGNQAAKRFWTAMRVLCGKAGDEDEIYEDDPTENELLFDTSFERDREAPFHWSPPLLQSFREELEKLVILDYLMLNTDRGADNYMLKFCDGEHEKAPVNTGPSRSAMPLMSELKAGSTPMTNSGFGSPSGSRLHLATHSHPHIHLAAIDNSLSFPHEHPKGWRSYTYGWLYLPVGVIGRPFSEKTRQQILPLLTSKEWWEETTFQLRKMFALDPDFHPKMFARQLAVVKGQAWNIVQSLRHADEGPLELTRRQKVLVWDDEIELPEDLDPTTPLSGGGLVNLSQSIGELPQRPSQSQRGSHRRSLSAGPDAFPPLRRRSSDNPAASRPVPFVSKSQQINKGLSGVAVLEHMERLDKVEAGMRRLGAGESVLEEEEEADVGEAAEHPSAGPSHEGEHDHEGSDMGTAATRAPTAEAVFGEPTSVSERVASPSSPNGRVRWANGLLSSMDALSEEEEDEPKRIVIMERLETVASQPFFACW
ncbi:hypothetical protein EXIGLDRAFT_672443 [Exidia glandulosa HHB12029]|uniref:Phosphatidylinositol 4-kinase n=1 Tax=Exidia glandulosa HHB12029 TaxID=1314781 RepID=A0A165JP08_EXIGL|nr:hypothetical protein EXIGLDRAFT_672443 [Exidia glandulosa HHB12029]